MNKFYIISGGCCDDTWCDHYFLLVDKTSDEMELEYRDCGGSDVLKMSFSKWLLAKGYVREICDSEIEWSHEVN